MPTVGGESAFDSGYAENPLVNAMCIGLLPAERVLHAEAQGVGNAIVLFGALTGRDGIGGASVLASQDLEGSDEKRPSVQIGDPFRGKALIEVSLELVERNLVVALQDCGAAGLASSLSEMASDGLGVEVSLDLVPLREPGLEAWEIMISESQERMVAVVAPELVGEVRAVCERWELPCTVIGEVTGDGELRAQHEGEIVGSIPAALLTDGCPRYEVDTVARQAPRAPVDPVNDEPKTWVFEQYDQLVGSRTVRRPGLDAAVLRLDGNRGLAVSLDGPPLGERDPYALRPRRRLRRRAQRRLCRRRAARAHRLPELRRPGQAGDRLGADARDRRDRRRRPRARLPVVSGNVSLYNETSGRAIPPTPVVGCVGLVRDVRGSRAAGAPATASSSCAGAAPSSCASCGATPSRSPSRTTSRTGGSRPRSRRRRSGPGPTSHK